MTTYQEAKEAAATLAAYFAELGDIHRTSTGAGLAETPATIVLPDDTNRSMADAYGPAIQPGTRGENVLDWFNFPADSDPRLYSRNGTVLTDHDGDDRPDHRLHRDAAPSFEAALDELWTSLGQVEFHCQGLHVYCGGWAYRRKTGGRTFSTHAWGAAVDLNAGQNGWKQKRTSFSSTTFDTFERHGWLSGYRAWGHDAMHFQRAIPSFISPGTYYDTRGLPKHITKAGA
jgi:hypothetical protein